MNNLFSCSLAFRFLFIIIVRLLLFVDSKRGKQQKWFEIQNSLFRYDTNGCILLNVIHSPIEYIFADSYIEHSFFLSCIYIIHTRIRGLREIREIIQVKALNDYYHITFPSV